MNITNTRLALLPFKVVVVAEHDDLHVPASADLGVPRHERRRALLRSWFCRHRVLDPVSLIMRQPEGRDHWCRHLRFPR